MLMIMPVMGEVARLAPTDPEKKKSLLGLCEKPSVAKVLVYLPIVHANHLQVLNSFMFDYLLLPYGSHPSLQPKEETAEEIEAGIKVEGIKVPAGLSDYAWRRVAGEALPSSESVEGTKHGLVKFLGAGLLPEMDVAMHLLVGTADTRHGVASTADTQMRQLSGNIDWNDPELVRRLYGLFLGSLVIKDRPSVKQEHKRQPSNTRLRLKLMPVILKSREAAIQFPSCIQVSTLNSPTCQIIMVNDDHLLY